MLRSRVVQAVRFSTDEVEIVFAETDEQVHGARFVHSLYLSRADFHPEIDRLEDDCAALLKGLLGVAVNRDYLVEHTSIRPQLTDTEVKVMTLVSQGKTIQQTAAALYSSASTVKTHLVALNKKLGTSNSPSMVMAGVKYGYLSL